MKRLLRILAGSVFATALVSSLGSAASTPRAGLNLIPDNTLNWGVLARQNYSLEDFMFGMQYASNTWTGINTFSSSTYLTYGTPGQCVATDANDQLITQSCLAGGSGASTLAVYVDGVQKSSPTAIVKFVGNQFRVGLPAGNTAQVDLNPNTTYFVQNTVVRQAGAAFSLDSGTVANLLTAGTAQITSGTYTNATISGPTLAYSSGTVSVALAVGTSSVNGQPLRVVDTTGNGIISFESPLSTTTMTLNLKNATAGSSAGLVETVQGAADAPTGAVAGDAIVRATNNLFLESGGPTSGRGIAISTNGVTAMYFADGSTQTVAGKPAGGTAQIQFNSAGAFGASSNFVYTESNGFLGSGDDLTIADSSSTFVVATQENLTGTNDVGAISNTDTILFSKPLAAPPFTGGSDWAFWFGATHKNIGGSSIGFPNRYQAGITSEGMIIEPFYTISGPTTFLNRHPGGPLQIGFGSRTPAPNNAKVIINYPDNGWPAAPSKGGTFVAISSDTGVQFYAGVVSSYVVVGSTSNADVHIDVNGVPKLFLDSGTGLTTVNGGLREEGVLTIDTAFPVLGAIRDQSGNTLLMSSNNGVLTVGGGSGINRSVGVGININASGGLQDDAVVIGYGATAEQQSVIIGENAFNGPGNGKTGNVVIGYNAGDTSVTNPAPSTNNTAIGAATVIDSSVVNTMTGVTVVGYGATNAFGAGNTTNATALGYNAIVAGNNHLVLGSTNPPTNVGIGVVSPTAAKFEVVTATSDAYGLMVSTGIPGAYILAVSTTGVTSVQGAFQLQSQTSAQIKALTPSAVGQEYYCSDCAAVAVCISTGTANGAFALVTSKTSACQ